MHPPLIVSALYNLRFSSSLASLTGFETPRNEASSYISTLHSDSTPWNEASSQASCISDSISSFGACNYVTVRHITLSGHAAVQVRDTLRSAAGHSWLYTRQHVYTYMVMPLVGIYKGVALFH